MSGREEHRRRRRSRAGDGGGGGLAAYVSRPLFFFVSRAEEGDGRQHVGGALWCHCFVTFGIDTECR
jgi:hypothetical protein